MDTSMQGKRVPITAAAAGIGREMALTFLAAAAGRHITGQAPPVCGNVETMA